MIKLIAIDLDGTLLSSEGTISKENIEALHYAHSKGVKIVLCTGRPYLFMKKFVTELGLNTTEDYIVTFNGGQVQRADSGEIVSKYILSTDDLKKWYELTEKLDLPLNLIDGEFVYEPTHYPKKHPSTYLKGRPLPTKTVDFASFDENHEFNKFVVSCDTEHLDQQIEIIPSEMKVDYSVFKSQSTLLEIVANGVNKGTTLKALAESLTITPEEIMTIGDQENDLSMIQMAGVGVAMANAVSIVKEHANFITTSNDDNGVAKAIYHFIK